LIYPVFAGVPDLDLESQKYMWNKLSGLEHYIETTVDQSR